MSAGERPLERLRRVGRVVSSPSLRAHDTVKPTILFLLGAVCGLSRSAAAAPAAGRDVLDAIESRRAACAAMAKDIWGWAEVGYKEQKSSARLQAELKAAGFEILSGVAEIPTAFVASYGRGKPVIAFLAEFDALPGLSQDAVPERKPLVENAPGHGCGHHLFGTASTAAAIAVKDWLASSRAAGTIRLYGTPAEEGGGGKVYMVRAGLFEDVDAVLTWHPGDRNEASPSSSLANVSAKFRFRGLSAHAAAAPDKGRSALDGVEAMNHMVNLMREHVPQAARIHYVITRGGGAPNVVPDAAESYYYARHPDMKALDGIWERIVRASQGAALGTGTEVEHEVIGGVYNVLPNEALARVMDASLRRVGGYRFSSEELAFAQRIRGTLGDARLTLESTAEVQPFAPRAGEASTDVGDVSWVVPTTQMTAATWVPGTPAHSWQAVAAGGTSIGVNGLMIAAKTLALTAVALFSDPAPIGRARAELEARRGAGFVYKARVGGRKPPLDYRN
jgi:aminobenzoyl-glutamate utilization protein B